MKSTIPVEVILVMNLGDALEQTSMEIEFAGNTTDPTERIAMTVYSNMGGK
jgi:hypothetical protein